MNATLAPENLTTADRCDRCGAQAYLLVKLPSGGELYFCNHHGREHEESLRESGADIVDESSRLAGS